MTAPTRPGEPTAVLLVAGALVTGATQIRLGHLDGLALSMAVLGFVLVWAVVPLRTRPTRVPTGVRWLARAGLLIHALAAVPLILDVVAGEGPGTRALALGSWAVAVAVAADLLADRPRLGRWGRPLLVAAIGVLGLLWLASIRSTIDVLIFQDVGTERLLDGINPYAFGYPNPYGEAGSTAFYGPGLATPGGELHFGFPYPPLSLFLAVPGALLGDVRFSHLAAMLLAGWILLHLSDGEHDWSARAGGVLLVTSPMLLPVVQRGWTESFLTLGLAVVVWVVRRGSGHRALAFGAFLAVKQYAVLFWPVMMALLPRLRTWRDRFQVTWQAGLVAAVITVPLALWSLREFVFSVGLLQFQQPFRPDAMSLPAFALRTLGWQVQGVATPVMFVAIVLASAWVIRKGERSLAGTTLGIAVVMLAFLLFSKQAFTNYYWFSIASIWTALAAGGEAAEATPPAAGSAPPVRLSTPT